MSDDIFCLTSAHSGPEPVHRLLMSKLTQHQATNLKNAMARVEPCSLSNFIDAFMKALNSVILYRHKHIVDTRLGHLFDECDKDRDSLISFIDLPLLEVLLGDDGCGHRSEVVVYNDHCTEVALSIPPGIPLHDIELVECTNLEYHHLIRKYTMCHANDVVMMELGDVNGQPTLEVTGMLTGHQAPVLATAYVPHVKKLFTASADRSVWGWSQEERFAVCERARTQSAVTCLTYDPMTQWLIGGSTDGYLLLFKTVPSLSHGAFRRILAHRGEWVLGVGFIPDIDVIASCGVDGAVHFWDHQTLAKKSTKLAHDSKGLQRIAYSRGHRALFTSSSSREVQMWSPFLNKPTETLSEHEKPIVGVHCFDHSPELITGDTSGKLCIWDMRRTGVVQVLGAPECVSPIGIITSFTYDTRRSAILALGERISMFIPQKGSYSALMDIPVTAITYCNITKKICVVSGNRILIFELTTGELLYSHSYGSVEISCAAMTPQQDLIFGTFEGTVIATVAGTWQTSRTLHVGDSVKLVYDLGKQSRVGLVWEENARALCVTSNGTYWHFCYGTTCEITGGPTSSFATGFDAIHCATFSAKSALLYMARKNVFEVWDISGNYKKTTQQLESWISAITAVDQLGATMISTTKGEVFAFHTITFVPIFKCLLSASFTPTFLGFDRMTWTLIAGTPQQLIAVPIDEVVRKAARHQRNFTCQLRSPKLMRMRFEVDTIVDTAAQEKGPVVMTCRDKETAEVCSLVVTEAALTQHCAQRVQLLKKLQQTQGGGAPSLTTPLRHIGTVVDSFIPLLQERCFDTNRHVYTVFEYFNARNCPIDYFQRVFADKTTPTPLLNIIVAEVKWLALCVAHALSSLHENGLVCLFNRRCVRLVPPEYKLFLDAGVWSAGDDGSGRLRPCDTPPEGVLEVRSSADCWLLGLLLYEICCERSLLPLTATTSQVENAFLGVDCAVTDAALEETIAAPLNDPLMRHIIHRLLAINPEHRFAAADVVTSLQHVHIPRHLTCTPVPTVGMRDAMLEVPCEELVRSRTRPVLPNATISTMAVCEVPTLIIAAEFNGISAHLVISNPSGKVVGLTPPNNEVSVLWSVGREEVSSMRFAAEDVDMISPMRGGGNLESSMLGTSFMATSGRARSPDGSNSGGTGGAGGGSGTESGYNPEKYCPFFSEMREVQKTLLEEVLPPAYYLEGWHRLKKIKDAPRMLSSKQIERERRMRLERTKLFVERKRANDFMSDKVDESVATNDRSATPGVRSKAVPGALLPPSSKAKERSLADIADDIKADPFLLHHTVCAYFDQPLVDKRTGAVLRPSSRAGTPLPSMHKRAFR